MGYGYYPYNPEDEDPNDPNNQSQYLQMINQGGTGPTFPTGNPQYLGGLDTPSGPPQPDSLPDPNQDNPLMSNYRTLLNKTTGPAQSAYTDFLNKGYPKEDDYKPSGWRRAAAIVAAGLGGYANVPNSVQTAKSILDDPYNKAKEQYQAEGTRLNQAANEEDRQSENKIRSVSSLISAQRADTADKRASDLAIYQGRRADTADTRAATDAEHKKNIDASAKFKQDHPDYVFKTGDNGNMFAFNPKDPSNSVDTGVNTGKMSELDKLQFGLDANLKAIASKGNEARRTKETAPGVNSDNWTPLKTFNPDSTPGPALEINKAGEVRPIQGVTGNLSAPPKTPTGPTTTESTTETKKPDQLFGLIPGAVTSKKTTTVKSPFNSPVKSVNPVNPPKKETENELRSRAIKALMAQTKKKETELPEVAISAAMNQLRNK